MKSERFIYPVIIRKNKDNEYVLNCIDIPKIKLIGDNPVKLIERAKINLNKYCKNCLNRGLNLPKPSNLELENISKNENIFFI